MPIYPVISMKGHGFSIKNLLCKDDPTKEETDYVSVDQHVSADSSPVFIVHSADDELVDARNSLDFAMAYANAGVPYELHIFPHAQHGCALGNAITDMGNPNWNDPMIARWVEMAAYWAEKICNL
jgi:acetyl esterase/lipase